MRCAVAIRTRATPVRERKQDADHVGDVLGRGKHAVVLALDVLQKRQSLTQGPERTLDACLAVWLGRRMLRLEEGPDRSRDVLRDAEDFPWNVCLALQRLKSSAERFPSVSCLVRS